MESPLVALLKKMINKKRLNLTTEQRFDTAKEMGVKTIVSMGASQIITFCNPERVEYE